MSEKSTKMCFGLLNGPNLSKLGSRDSTHYGTLTLGEIEKHLQAKAESSGYGIVSYQSHVEGYLIDFVCQHDKEVSGWIVNPGALMMSGYALADAILDSPNPFVEVHISQIFQRESKRHHSLLSPYVYGQIVGFGAYSYELALYALMDAHQNGKISNS